MSTWDILIAHCFDDLQESPNQLLRMVSTKNWQNCILDHGPIREFDI